MYKKCCSCENRIKGRFHARNKANSIMKSEYYCERCWQLKGQPAPLSLSKLYLKTYA